jgi:hypothetical protein
LGRFRRARGTFAGTFLSLPSARRASGGRAGATWRSPRSSSVTPASRRRSTRRSPRRTRPGPRTLWRRPTGTRTGTAHLVRVGRGRDRQLLVVPSESPRKAATISPLGQWETQAKEWVHVPVDDDQPCPAAASSPPNRVVQRVRRRAPPSWGPGQGTDCPVRRLTDASQACGRCPGAKGRGGPADGTATLHSHRARPLQDNTSVLPLASASPGRLARPQRSLSPRLAKRSCQALLRTPPIWRLSWPPPSR